MSVPEIRFSKRVDWNLAANPLTLLLEKLRQSGEQIFDLTQSNPTRVSFRYLEKSLLNSFQTPEALRYEPASQGLLSARQTVCAYYKEKGVSLEPDQIFLTASTSEAYSFLFRLLFDPHDVLLVPAPGYPLLEYLTGLHDLTVKRYLLSYNEKWTATFQSEDFEEAAGILLLNPNNPTGNYLQEKELEMLHHYLARFNRPVICDEVFLDYPLIRKGGEMAVSKNTFASQKQHLNFTLSGISKVLGLPQMKLSWIVVQGPEKMRRQAIEKLQVIADSYLSVSTPVQHAFIGWMERRHEIQTEIGERVQRNYEFLRNTFQSSQDLRLLNADGGWYSLIEIHSDSFDEENFVQQLLKKTGVLVHPGFFYDFQDGNFLVVSLLPESKIFEEGIRRLCSFLHF